VERLVSAVDPRFVLVTERPFDLDEHRRRRLQAADRRIEALLLHRAQLERLLALACRVAVGGTAVSADVLLDVIEQIDNEAGIDAPALPKERLLGLLGEVPTASPLDRLLALVGEETA